MRGGEAYGAKIGHNPLDVVEDIVAVLDWAHERRSDSEMSVQAPGTWADYNLFFAWSEDMRAIHLSCAFEMRNPVRESPELFKLLALINERMWLGHFALWSAEKLPMFRQTMFVPIGGASEEPLERLVEIALGECERFFPAFQFVVWGGKSAEEAVEAAMLDTQGEA